MKLPVLAALVLPAVALASTPPSSASVQAGLTAAMPAKLAVAEHFATTGQWPTDNASAGFSTSADSPNAINVGAKGVVTITFGGPTITLTPSDGGKGRVTWSCKGAGFEPGVLPPECR